MNNELPKEWDKLVVDAKAACGAFLERNDALIIAADELIKEQQAHIERLRTIMTRVMSCDDLIFDSDVFLAVPSYLQDDIKDALNETPAQSLEALKREWQAEALENALSELNYCGSDGESWRSELSQYAMKLREGHSND